MQWTKCFGGTLLVILGLSLTGSSLGAAEPTWKVGTAKAVITPEKAMWLAGYGHRDRPSDGKLTDLWVKVLALEAADGTRGVVVTSDLLGFPEAMYETIYERLHKQHGLERSQLMLTCSHTHSSPVLSGALYDCYPLDDAQRAIIDEYSKHLVDTVVATVNEALGAMTPATLWSGQGSCDFAVNRRKNREADVVKLRQQGVPLRGPSDHDVPVLVVRTPEGKPRAVVFGYACHSTTLCGYEWCGDYSGYTQIELEKAHPGLQAMFYIGCGADQNPLPRRSVELCQKYGTMLTASVEAVLAGDFEARLAKTEDRLRVRRGRAGRDADSREPEGGHQDTRYVRAPRRTNRQASGRGRGSAQVMQHPCPGLEARRPATLDHHWRRGRGRL